LRPEAIARGLAGPEADHMDARPRADGVAGPESRRSPRFGRTIVTLSELLASARQLLRTAGVNHPDVEAELAISHVLGLKRSEIYLEPARPVTGAEEAAVRSITDGRARRFPLQYLLGEIEFMGLPLIMREGVFIPRPETETLVEAVIARRPADGTALRILDLCTGSGAIAVSLAHYLAPSLVVAADISLASVRLARDNARYNRVLDRVSVVVADGLGCLGTVPPVQADGAQRAVDGLFDIVVSNPPYIATGEIEGLEPEVRDFEPREALDGGRDGLRFVAGILPQIPSILRAGSIVAFEIGAAQAEAVGGLFAEAGLGALEVIRDLAGRDRVVIGRRDSVPAK
jgi:release factor glutamine methyltransferase